MKIIFLLALLPSLTFAARSKLPPDLPPDVESSHYQAFLGVQGVLSLADGLDNVKDAGMRNLLWLQHINSLRPAGDKLSFTSKDSQRGIPIEEAKEYNPTLIQGDLTKLKAEMPGELQEVIFSGKAFTDTPPIAIPDYLEWGRKLDRTYQSALRWTMMSGWLSYLEGRRHEDLRGWYFLHLLEGRAEKLRSFSSLEEAERQKLRNWLVGVCFNDTSRRAITDCQNTIDQLITKGADLEAYYQSKASLGAGLYASHFAIPNYVGRSEIRWEALEGGGSRLVAPFRDPENAAVASFLTVNIQDEWKFGDWHLELPLVPAGRRMPYVVFERGATPNVNGLGGDRITMNAEQPLTEYDAQWTIRHEYGHVLGFPDCYVEFYERERNVIVNYQIDVDNLMCSRRGHIQEKHRDELKRVYQRASVF